MEMQSKRILSINNSIVENSKSDTISQFLEGEEKNHENSLGSQLAILPNLLKRDTIEITVKRGEKRQHVIDYNM